MAKNAIAELCCDFVGEYVEETDLSGKPSLSWGEVIRPQVVADYFDTFGQEEVASV
jgi:hypothetical protein